MFCDSTKTVIYEVFTGYDPFCLDDSAYFTRFDIDPRTYKNKIEMFPSNLVASIFGFKEEPFFEASEEERKNVQVKF